MPRKRQYRRRYRRKNKPVAKSVKNYVSNMLNKNIEKKYYNYGIELAGVNTTGTIFPACHPTQGTGDLANRIGDRLKLKSLHIRATLTVADTTNVMRLIWFQYNSLSNITTNAPTSTNVLDVTGASISPVFAQYLFDSFSEHIVILSDRTYSLSTSNSIKNVNYYVPLKYAKKTIRFSAAGTLAYNHIYLLAISDSGTVSHPSLVGSIQSIYTDA